MSKLTRVFLVAIVALAPAGCSKPEEDAVKIGMNLELTGDIPAVGASSRNAAQMFFDRLNQEGGIQLQEEALPVRLVIRDNAAKDDQAAFVAQDLISRQGVLAMIGPNSSTCAIPAGEIAEALKCVMISPWSTDPRTTIDQSSGAAKRYVFRGCFTDPFQGRLLAKFARENLGATNAAVLSDPSEKLRADLFRETFSAAGGGIGAFEVYHDGDLNIAPQIEELRAAAPDLIYLPAYHLDVPAVARQIREAGLDVPLLGSDTWMSPDLLQRAGPDIDGSYLCRHFSEMNPAPGVAEFVADYTAKFGAPPDDVAALTYDVCGILVAAMKESGKPTREGVREGLVRLRHYEGVTGKFTFTPGSGDPLKTAPVLRIEDDGFVWAAEVEP